MKASEKSEDENSDGSSKSSSVFSWLMNPFGGKGVERSVVHGDVSYVASTEKKQLSETQKALLEKIRPKK